jgi:hypothetical protein
MIKKILDYMQLPVPWLPESTTSLLVHFGSWSYTINGHEKNLPRSDHAKQNLDGENYVYVFTRQKHKYIHVSMLVIDMN